MNNEQLKPIKGYGSFWNIYQTGKKFYRSEAMSTFCFIKDDTDIAEAGRIINFGVAISKRNAKHAVVRNRIKRLLRESIRQVMKEVYADEEKECPFDKFIIAWRRAPKKPNQIGLDDVLPHVRYLIKKAHRYHKATLKEEQ